MTREAARSGFEAFVDDALDYTETEFSVANALGGGGGTGGPGGKVVDRFLKDVEVVRETVVDPELDAYREQILTQFDVLLDALEADEDVDEHREAVLASDVYAQNIRPGLPSNRREAVLQRLFERQRDLAAAVRPLVETPETEFWAAAEAAYQREEMSDLVEAHFAFTAPLSDHRGAFRMTTTIDPGEVLGGGFLVSRLPEIEVEYTDEAFRSMRRAERRVIRETNAEIDRRF